MNSRILLPTLLALTVATVVAGCGSADNVATVGSTAITKEQYKKQAASSTIQAVNSGFPGATKDLATCTANLMAKAKAAGQPLNAATKKQSQQTCKDFPKNLRTQVMTSLISATWVRLAAKDAGVKVSDAEVQATYKQAVAGLPAGGLAKQGLSESQAKEQVQLNLLNQRLVAAQQKKTAPPTAAARAAALKQNPALAKRPATRDVNIIVTKTKAEAQKAMSRVEKGESFAAVAKDVSTDQASRANNGMLTGIGADAFGPAIEKQLAAAPGKVIGPVQLPFLPFGWSVVQVVKTHPAQKLRGAKLNALIDQYLKSSSQQAATQAVQTALSKKYRPMTKCEKGYIVPLCSNSPTKPQSLGGAAPAPTASGGAATPAP